MRKNELFQFEVDRQIQNQSSRLIKTPATERLQDQTQKSPLICQEEPPSLPKKAVKSGTPFNHASKSQNKAQVRPGATPAK
mmetsp:Transcript_4459/g.7623  ORF Transcript_4459/g.7623 Transcript_4459/m.7623 type:complete len:81 (+) Transcript_4459:947-1189(+)